MKIFEVRPQQITAGVDPLLSRIALGFALPTGLVGDQAVKDIPSNFWSLTLRQYDKSIHVLYDAKRAAKAMPKEIFSEMSETTVKLAEHALGTNLDNSQELDRAASVSKRELQTLENNAIHLLHYPLMLEKEYLKSLMLFSTAYYAATNRTTLSGTDQWTDKTNSDPVTDVDLALDTAQSYMGMYPNTVTMGIEAWQAFSVHPKVLALLATTGAAKFTQADFLFHWADRGVKKLVIGGSNYAVAPDSDTFTRIWGGHCAVTYVPDDSEMNYVQGLPLHSACFNLTGFPKVHKQKNAILTQYFNRVAYLVTNLSTTNGYLIKDCV